MQMETFTMDNGKTTKLMDSVNTLILMEPSTKDTGLMINSMDKERKSGQMVQSMKVTINSERKTALESFYGLINLHTLVTSWTTTFMVMVNTNGLMEESSLVTGFVIRCMVKVSLLGQMAENIMETTTTIRSRVTEYSPGQMAGSTMVLG